MNILVTGSKGFVGKNLVENLKTIKNGYNTQIRYDANAINRINEKNYRNNFKKGVNDENF